ncbi:hypothetical protein B296_00042530 [Ensete ventricosum]|uniref:Uncharacterized protein n=1 Tax=Ensete ventricosum TaxID=4639 RepID=A0A426XPU9_ENSVE|nr:hypothetical protein B296_00042530 [Ensete ventricosum]
MTTMAAMVSSVQILSLAASQQCCRHPWPLLMQQRLLVKCSSAAKSHRFDPLCIH